jgi:hypothetical protein
MKEKNDGKNVIVSILIFPVGLGGNITRYDVVGVMKDGSRRFLYYHVPKKTCKIAG